jgi:hypothetical protein
VPAHVEPVEERRARAADVEIAGRRRRETQTRLHERDSSNWGTGELGNWGCEVGTRDNVPT